MTQPTEPTTSETPKASKEEIQALLNAYGIELDAHHKAQAVADAHKANMSATLKVLAERAGKGKYRFRGNVLMLTSRVPKGTKEGSREGEVFYLRAPMENPEILGGD